MFLIKNQGQAVRSGGVRGIDAELLTNMTRRFGYLAVWFVGPWMVWLVFGGVVEVSDMMLMEEGVDVEDAYGRRYWAGEEGEQVVVVMDKCILSIHQR
jgi:hypothetical protein